jgi:hypothetical protein
MILNHPNLYACPHCESVISILNWMSANTFNGIFYSDGKAVYPNFPDLPDLTKCHQCNNFLWLSKLREIELPENFRKQAELKSKDAEFLSIEDLFKAIETGFIEKGEMLFVRFCIWHSYNDRVRAENGILFKDLADEKRWQENLDELKKLLDPNDQFHILLTAEIERNLKNYNEAILLLNSISVKNLQDTKLQIIEACKNGISTVFEIHLTKINNEEHSNSDYVED